MSCLKRKTALGYGRFHSPKMGRVITLPISCDVKAPGIRECNFPCAPRFGFPPKFPSSPHLLRRNRSGRPDGRATALIIWRP